MIGKQPEVTGKLNEHDKKDIGEGYVALYYTKKMYNKIK